MAKVDISGSTILVVDDIAVNVQLVLSILSRYGYKSSFALNGKDALLAVEADPPDLILLDIMMPGMDGYEVCSRLKSMSGFDHIPVIFLTGRAESDDTVRGFDVGAVDYVTKPFHETELIRRVETHLRLSKAYSELETFNMLLDARVAEKTIELEHLNKSLEEALSSAQRLERMKYDFISSVFHEFRTPMTVIQIAADLLSRFVNDDNKKHLEPLLNRHRSATESLTGILEMARDFMYLHDAIINEEMKNFPLRPLVDDVLKTLKSLHSDVEERVQILHPEVFEMEVSQKYSALDYTVKELITNALRYSPKGSPVIVALQQEDNMLMLSISNEIGSATHIDKKILQPFVRGDEHTEMGNFRGLGLGLHLVQQCLEEMNGRLTMEYAEGTAVTFYSSFPIKLQKTEGSSEL